MNNDRDLMQEALDALTYVGDKDIYSDTIDALRARLAQPEQEPTPSAWAWVYPSFWDDLERVNCGTAYRNPTVDRIPLYTAPPPRKWVGLTKEELAEIAEFHFHGALSGREFYDDVEAKLKEKNT